MSRKIKEGWQKITEEMIDRAGSPHPRFWYTSSYDRLYLEHEHRLGLDIKIGDSIYKGCRGLSRSYSRYDSTDKRSYHDDTLPWTFYTRSLGDHSEAKVREEDLLSDGYFRYPGAKKLNSFIDDLEVGDFVQFSGQRDSKSWRKIVAIDYHRFTIFGWKYREPIDDPQYDLRYSSENGMQFLKALRKVER